MPDLAPLRPGDPARVREYRLTARLGEGGQGTVYLGESPAGVRVAVKLLRADLAQDEEALERFVREVSTTRQVSPFCTAAVLETGVDEHRPYIVSEYIDGPTLDAVVGAEGPRSGSALHRLAIGTVTALVAIHQAGIVHRDFKPSNVLLASDGPRVIDFGIAKALDRTSTLTATAIGTPAYMTPEQLAGENAGSAADMFAWGCTMVFAATGQPPFGTDSLPAIFNRIMNMEPDLSAIADPALRELVGHCLAKDAGRRPTASEALMRLLGHAGPGAQGTPPPTSPRGMLAEGLAAAQQTGPEGYPYASGPQGPVPYQTGPGGFAQQSAPGGYPPHQTGPGGFPYQSGPQGPGPNQTGPGGYPPHQTGPGGFAQQPAPGGYPPHQTGPGGFAQPGPGGFAQQPYGGPTVPSQGGPAYPAAGRAKASGGVRRIWVAIGAGLVVALIAVGVTVVLRGNGTPGPTATPQAGPSGQSSAPPTPAVASVPEADRKIKLPGSSITIHESDKDPIKLSSYSLERDKHLYVRKAGTDEFVKNDKYFQYTLNFAGTHALGTDRVYSTDSYAIVSIVDHESGAESKVKITKAPVYPIYPQWSPDGTKGLVTLYEAAGDKSNPYGYAIIDVATKKAEIVRVKEKDAGTWSYFWRGDGRAVGTWALTGKTQRIRFYDLQGTVLQTLLDVGTPLTVEGDDINPSGTLLMTYCKGGETEICVWSTAADGEPTARIPFDTKRLVGWYDDQHIVAWQAKGSSHEAVIIDLKGQVKRVLATSTDAKEYEQQFMRYTRER
ncbi:protein kinase [Planomonospora sp. ID67723]|uniref:serine/threonine protein kinase n=1 Tax=Planomonospora sp. ID67723 TaxID=2738134 RepID=UPI0018C3C254|nr:serine/threonine-protein kinase [Planomonospora sp. ID67723]MBG0829329.1 protein kinase [Planomonospora sp. ID67723]